jgi:hypothetical protein
MRLWPTFMLLTICLTAIGQTSPVKKDNQNPLTFYPGTYDTEYYTDSEGKVVIIQNSLPEGLEYTDPTGKNFGGRIFWSRVINETSTPLELTINFPADSFAMLPWPHCYLKVFLPPMATLYAYDATGLKSFLDTGMNKPTMFQRTINPKEACLFYVGVLFLGKREGVTRAGLVLKEADFFYRINLLDPALIPCGKIVFKN